MQFFKRWLLHRGAKSLGADVRMKELCTTGMVYEKFIINGLLMRSALHDEKHMLVTSCSGVSTTYTDDGGRLCTAYGRLRYLLVYTPFPGSEPIYLIAANWFDGAATFAGLPRVRDAPASSLLNRSIFGLAADVSPCRLVYAPIPGAAGEFAVLAC